MFIKHILVMMLFIIFPLCISIIPQSIPFEHLTTKNGLSNNNVNDVIQDQLGFLWFATDDGLNRYDGYDFKIFRHDLSNKNSLSDNTILDIFEDKKGYIWIGTKEGWLNRYDPVFEHFSKWKIQSKILEENPITSIYEDSQNMIWIGTYRSGLFRLDPNKGIINHWEYDPADNNSLSNNHISSIVEDEDNNLWISTYNGLNKFEYKNNSKNFTHYFKESKTKNCISDNTIWYLSKSENESKKIWIGTANGLTLYDSKSKTFSQIQLINPNNLQFGTSAGTVVEEFFGEEKILWIDSYAGVIRLNIESGEILRFIFNINDPNSPLSNQVNRIIKDKTGVLWLATNRGISFISPRSIRFDSQIINKNKFLNISALTGQNITSITKTINGSYWFGTEKGLFNSDIINGRHFIKHISNLNELNIWSLTKDHQDNIWIGTYGYGLYQLESKTGNVKSWLGVENRNQTNSIKYNKVVYCDNEQNIWIGFWGKGLARLSPNNNEYKTWTHVANDPTSLSHDDVWTIYQDSKSRIWIGTNGGGLNLFDSSLYGKFYHWVYNDSVKGSLSSNSIYSICESKYGRNKSSETKTILWIGTNNGLSKFEIINTNYQNNNFPDTVIISNYKFISELSAYPIKSIVEDYEGNLWLGTSSGIFKFLTESKTYINLNDNYEGAEYDFNFLSSFRDSDGMILMGSKSDLKCFYPKNVYLSTFIPPIYITDFQIFNSSFKVGEQLEKNIIYSKEILLSYSQDVITIKFAALDYSSRNTIQYKYKLEGFDKEWVFNGHNRTATYTNLSGGEYTFFVKSSNCDGVWNENVAAIKLIITPPWWQTIWAIIMYVVILIIGVAGIVKFHINRVRIQHELKMQEFEAHHLREIEKMKSRFFTNLSHEFRTPLMLIKGPLEQLMRGKIKFNIDEYYKMILRNTEKLQNLIDQLLELSQLEAENVPIKKQDQDIVSVLRLITESYYLLANELGIKLTFYSTEDRVIASIDKDKLEKIINNLLNNAFKFTPSLGSIYVELSIDKQEHKNIAKISIRDTGIGIPEEHRSKIFDRFYQIDDSSKRNFAGSGIGLAIVKELADLHNWNISVFSKENEGTIFTLRIPLEKTLNQNTKGTSLESNTIIKQLKSSSNSARLNIENISSPGDVNINLENKPIIYFIEDSSDMRQYLFDLLSTDYEVKLFEKAIEGFEEAITQIPDLIISDIMMPGIDGVELCHKIKVDWRTSHIPIILLTAKSTQESKLEGLKIGADDYITKPFSSEELLARIKNIINQRKSLREKFTKEINIQVSSITNNSIDKEFINKIISILEKNLSNEDFDLEELAKEIFTSRRQLHRKLFAITGQAPGEFIRIFKLKRAAQMIIENRYSITQIALEIGYKSPAHFSRSFSKYFNCSPSDFRERYSHIS